MSDTPNPDSVISEWDEHDKNPAADVARQLYRELTAAQAEIARLRAGGCARDQRTTQFCGEAVKLQEENAKLQERVGKLIEAGDGCEVWADMDSSKAWQKAKDTQ